MMLLIKNSAMKSLLKTHEYEIVEEQQFTVEKNR